jgi:FkbM family methyltransferase
MTVRARDLWPPFEVFALNEYDFSFIEWDRVTSVMDCGAHVGSFALWVSTKAACRILAVEAHPATYGVLARNLAPLRARATAINVALAGEPGSRKLFDFHWSGMASLRRTVEFGSGDPVQTFDVPAMTLAQLLDTNGFESVDLLKMDIEGAEGEVFQTISTETLSRFKQAIIEWHPVANSDAEFAAAKLRAAGMKVAWEHNEITSLLLGWRS